MKSNFFTFILMVLFLASIFTTSFAQSQLRSQQENPTESTNTFVNFNNNKTLARYDSTTLDSFILATMNTYHIPGVQACIVKDDQIIWKGAYGYANIAQNRLVTDSTLFYLASISKTVTATSLMQLWEQGLFNLDDSVNNYLPFPVRNPNHPSVPITFRMLLTHSSSIHDTWSVLWPLWVWGSDSPIALDSFLVNYLVPGSSYYNTQNYNSWAPGTYDYTNVGATLIGYLVESISDTSFEKYCQDSIFIPLGMNEASWYLANLDPTHIAMLYGSNYSALGQSGDPWVPAGQLRTSASQLSRYLRAYIQKGQFNGFRLLDSVTVDLMTTVHQIGSDGPFGLQWRYHEGDIPLIGTRPIWYHNGGSPGAGTLMGYIKGTEENIGVIVFINLESDVVFDIGFELLSYGLLYNKIYAQNVSLNSSFIQVNTDSLTLNTEFINPNNHNFSANGIITLMDSTFIDSMPLFDDGNHGDLQAGDGIWGNYLLPMSVENEFLVGISTTDLVSSEHLDQNSLLRFTTIGPLNLIDYQLGNLSGRVLPVKISLKNNGTLTTASEVTAHLSPNDTNIIKINVNDKNFGDIPAGESRECSGSYYLTINPNVINDSLLTLKFILDISSTGYVFWHDSSQIVLSIDEDLTAVPTTYSLAQNHPNPFNPSTKISFTLPKPEHVTLNVYNTLGQKVATLLDQKMNAGAHDAKFDASDMPSGIYFYRIQAGEFSQVRKMVLLR